MRRLIIVKREIIAIPQRARTELYPGRKYAIARAKVIIMTQRRKRSVKTFPIMCHVLSFFSVISLIVIV